MTWGEKDGMVAKIRLILGEKRTMAKKKKKGAGIKQKSQRC